MASLPDELHVSYTPNGGLSGSVDLKPWQRDVFTATLRAISHELGPSGQLLVSFGPPVTESSRVAGPGSTAVAAESRRKTTRASRTWSAKVVPLLKDDTAVDGEAGTQATSSRTSAASAIVRDLLGSYIIDLAGLSVAQPQSQRLIHVKAASFASCGWSVAFSAYCFASTAYPTTFSSFSNQLLGFFGAMFVGWTALFVVIGGFASDESTWGELVSSSQAVEGIEAVTSGELPQQQAIILPKFAESHWKLWHRRAFKFLAAMYFVMCSSMGILAAYSPVTVLDTIAGVSLLCTAPFYAARMTCMLVMIHLVLSSSHYAVWRFRSRLVRSSLTNWREAIAEYRVRAQELEATCRASQRLFAALLNLCFIVASTIFAYFLVFAQNGDGNTLSGTLFDAVTFFCALLCLFAGVLILHKLSKVTKECEDTVKFVATCEVQEKSAILGHLACGTCAFT